MGVVKNARSFKFKVFINLLYLENELMNWVDFLYADTRLEKLLW